MIAPRKREADEPRAGDAIAASPSGGDRPRLRLRLVQAAFALLLALVTVLTAQLLLARREGRGAAPPVLGQVGGFELLDRSGRPVAGRELAGEVWVADFIFTRCSTICPRMTAAMASLATDAEELEELRFVSFTVDPEHDSPAVLARYAEGAGADPERWLFLTGDRTTIYDLSRGSFRLGVAEAGPDSAGRPPPAGEAFIHSTRFTLVDRAGRIRGFYDSTDETALRALRADAKRLLEEPRREPAVAPEPAS